MEKDGQAVNSFVRMAYVLSVSVELIIGKSPKFEFAKLLHNEKVHSLVMMPSHISITDQVRIMDIFIYFLERTTVKDTAQ
jgi:hypothetical protein